MRISKEKGSRRILLLIIGQAGGNIFIAPLYLNPSALLKPTDLDTIYSIVGSSEAIMGADLNARHPDWEGKITNEHGRVVRN